MAYIPILYPTALYGPTGTPIVVPTPEVAATFAATPPVPDAGLIQAAVETAADTAAAVITTDPLTGALIIMPLLALVTLFIQ